MFMHFHDYAQILKPTLDAAFTEHLATLLGDMWPLQSGDEANLLTGGKKIRGILLCLVANALGGNVASALPGAVAIELIQMATLVHDDFVDQHHTRRNLPSLWTLEGARKAVLLGDVVFSSAIHMMSEQGRMDGLIVSRAIAELSRGAYKEPLNPAALLAEIEAERMDGALYKKIIYLKTGILFGAACELGAVAARADEETQRSWRSYGLKIGEAYQIADDLHDLEHSLKTCAITADEMTALAPALLFFVKESRPFILEVLRRGALELQGEPVRFFQAAAKAMAEEKERLLRSAVADLVGDSLDSRYSHLVRKTPWDLVRLFDETTAKTDGATQSDCHAREPYPRVNITCNAVN